MLWLHMVQQKRALKRLVQEMRVGPGVIDMYYYSKASGDECPSGWVREESRTHAQGHSSGSYGNLFKKSKLEIQNCLSARMVIAGGLEPPTYCLEGSCSIQLSYATVKLNAKLAQTIEHGIEAFKLYVNWNLSETAKSCPFLITLQASMEGSCSKKRCH